MSKIIDGKALAEKIKDELVGEILKLKTSRPDLAIILVGERADSKLYVEMKEKEAKKIGIDTHLYKCPENISENELYDVIEFLNKDTTIDAILVQLPLPENFDTDGIIAAIDKEKDVDRFHPDNLEVLLKTCNHQHVMPPVFAVVLEMLKSIDVDPKDKQICIVANSDIFGVSLARVLECKGAHVDAVKGDDKALVSKTKEADILISALGRPKFIKKKMVKKDAVVIDIGISREAEKICGDVDFDEVEKVASFITPVPGGVGPMTIAMLFKNTLELYKKRH